MTAKERNEHIAYLKRKARIERDRGNIGLADCFERQAVNLGAGLKVPCPDCQDAGRPADNPDPNCFFCGGNG